MSEALRERLEDLRKSSPKQFKKKLDKVLETLGLVNIQCNRVYDVDMMKLIISSAERGEEPQVLVVRTWNEERGEEVQIVYLGEHHVEDLTYFKSNPKTWNRKRYGYMVLKPIQAKKLADILAKVKMEFEPYLPVRFYYWRLNPTT